MSCVRRRVFLLQNVERMTCRVRQHRDVQNFMKVKVILTLELYVTRAQACMTRDRTKCNKVFQANMKIRMASSSRILVVV